MPLLLRHHPKKLLWTLPTPTVNNKTPTRPVPRQLTEKPWLVIPSTLCARAVNQWQVPRRGAHPARYLIVFALNFWEGGRQKWGMKIMMLRANSLLPCRGESKQKTKWEGMGAVMSQEGEMRKHKVSFFDKTVFGLIFLGLFLLLCRTISRLFAPSFKD